MRILLISIILIIFPFDNEISAGLLINEVVTGSSDDWAELYLSGTDKQMMDISGLYVTMYYGTNEPLSSDPVTIYSYDRHETPYDDRYVVVHFTEPGKADETDLTGDTNKNGYIDLYCNNYYGSLWNSEGVVAIDTDDIPSNGGIIDFLYYSNNDGESNSNIDLYVINAGNSGQWDNSGCSGQGCSADIGSDGLKSYMSIARKNVEDSNSRHDFSITRFQTPGRGNKISSNTVTASLFSSNVKNITIIPTEKRWDSFKIPLTVYESCNIRFRIFTVTGFMVHESPLIRSVNPGSYKLALEPALRKLSSSTGLYICHIEATSKQIRRSENRIVYIILSKYR